MRMFPVVSLLVLVHSAFAGETATVSSCYQKASTQLEMQQCAALDYRAADAELNRVYRLIRRVYKDESAFLHKLQQAQRAWLRFRDAQFALKFPHAKERLYYGSAFPMCADAYKARLTLERVGQLKQWLQGREEGDVCHGSTKHRDDIQAVIQQIRRGSSEGIDHRARPRG